MRIAHVLLSRGFAGTERATAEMCNAHSADGHAVLIVLKRGHRTAGGVSIRSYLAPQVQVVEVGNWWPRSALAHALAQFQPDVIHAHLRRSTRLLARIRPAAPTIATLHLTVNGPQFAAMDGLICIARWQHRDVPRGYRGRLFDINESIIPAARLAPEQVGALRHELGVRPDEFLVGGVGRLAQSKGFDVLIEAFRRAALPRARLVILGEGRERQRLQARCGPGVALAGFRSNIKDYYQAFDVFVSPSRSEPLGRVVLEALDAGVPVIASRTEGPSQLLQQYPGDLVPIGDADALAAALVHHYETRPPRLSVDLSAWHIDAVAAATLAAYEELIDAARRPAAGQGGS